jgi:hypothetical protein
VEFPRLLTLSRVVLQPEMSWASSLMSSFDVGCLRLLAPWSKSETTLLMVAGTRSCLSAAASSPLPLYFGSVRQVRGEPLASRGVADSVTCGGSSRRNPYTNNASAPSTCLPLSQ